MASGSKKKYVIAKQGKYATVAGGLGGKPKVYATVKAAQADIDSNVKLKGGVVTLYDAPAEAPPTATAAAGMPAKAKPKAKKRAVVSK